MRLKIKNWAEYQHYKDRAPPWIKLHFKILHSRDWVKSSDTDRVLAIASMLIASQDDAGDGSFDADPEYFQRVAYLRSEPNFNNLIKLGFLDDASGCKQTLAKDTTETEAYKEETDKKKSRKPRMVVHESSQFDAAWIEYPRKGDTSKAASLKAWNARVKDGEDPEAMLAGVIRYAAYCRAMQTENTYIKQPATFFGPDKHYLTSWEIPQRSPHENHRNTAADTIAAFTGQRQSAVPTGGSGRVFEHD